MTSLAARLSSLAERTPLPDALIGLGINHLVGRTRRALDQSDMRPGCFSDAMASRPIAEYAKAANRQHYEIPPEFFGLTLGPRRKYSCCLYPTGQESLERAELHALEETAAHAGLQDGQEILELGCGWGSLSLFMATRFPQSRVVAVSNSAQQRHYIESQIRGMGLSNLRVITADMNDFTIDQQFDRVVSVEMFEHMANWRALLTRVRGWLRPQGRLFIHIFAHENQPYRFDHEDEADWIAQHFFTGGIMPSHGLITEFPDLFTLERDWRWNGKHYERTARDWLRRYDSRLSEIRPILKAVYGADAPVWERRWRLFFLATAGLFGHARGKPWGVSHYLLAPVL
ncbi:SAM-dependent methyltransferase [Acidocella aminolytica]|jgi:cyclopropane-fatty-acyl-phospholipid synthase|uniref:Methyltransferase n=1 Tax=Acidocella aminolytica 101 = DSM 11237 TaxID=1120923 RepID=A0A0D6PE60_9PROT|nr:cyclopropane-fatty-acyl-phospholipid synthase family protein [Acidocella aminolytica]GAN79134.1 methyltransferase [Acidocella aminolytica 101 = DSM 11237]GBQ43721.1 methyltransferase [Acidocella aminolytica 101 = DSM 11237]SHE66110.1 cyclopropane-fatty-acyl-phospholipid synthase [Acidocella aminolytica 101 = DSM 11237]